MLFIYGLRSECELLYHFLSIDQLRVKAILNEINTLANNLFIVLVCYSNVLLLSVEMNHRCLCVDQKEFSLEDRMIFFVFVENGNARMSRNVI